MCPFNRSVARLVYAALLIDHVQMTLNALSYNRSPFLVGSAWSGYGAIVYRIVLGGTGRKGQETCQGILFCSIGTLALPPGLTFLPSSPLLFW